MTSLFLDVRGLSTEEICDQWLKAERMHRDAVALLKEAESTEPQCGHPECKSEYAREMDSLERELCVLNAWCELLHATWMFAHEGTTCAFLEGRRIPMYDNRNREL